MSIREFLPIPLAGAPSRPASAIALVCALSGLYGGCSLLEGGNSPRTAVRILEGGAVSDRHYARVSPERVEAVARAVLLARGWAVDEAERGGRSSATSWTLDASSRTDGRVLVLIDQVDPADVQVTVQVIPADEKLARDLQDEIAHRLSALGGPTSRTDLAPTQ